MHFLDNSHSNTSCHVMTEKAIFAGTHHPPIPLNGYPSYRWDLITAAG
jgi:hypothetical protein